MTLAKFILRIVTILWIVLFGSIVSGQQDVDAILKARVLVKSGKTSQAVDILGDAIIRKGSSRLYSERGESYLEAKDLQGALSDFNQANRVDEHSGDYGLAKVYAIKGDASTSLYHLGMNLTSVYKKSEKEILLEPAFALIENRVEWRQFWKKDWFSFTERTVSEIEYLVSRGNIDDAVTLLSGLKRNSSDIDEILYSETLLGLASEKYNEAVSNAIKLTSLDPGNEKYLRLLARIQTLQSNNAGASVTYSKLIESGVADAQLLILRAECYRKTMEPDKAMRDIEKFLGLYPESKTALSVAGKVKAESGDNLKALEYFSKNLNLHPNDPDCYIDRANSYFAARSWEWAVKDYSMSLDLQPGNPDAWMNKGIALLSEGKVNDACHDFKKAYSLGHQKSSSYISKHCINK